jgi:hypothetical protein
MQLDGGGKFASAKNLKTGDVMTFKDAGQWKESKFLHPEKKMDGTPHPMAGQPKKDLQFSVSVNGEDMIFTCNNTNKEILRKAFGSETAKWVGRKCGVTIIKVSVGGQLKDSVMLTPTSATAKGREFGEDNSKFSE